MTEMHVLRIKINVALMDIFKDIAVFEYLHDAQNAMYQIHGLIAGILEDLSETPNGEEFTDFAKKIFSLSIESLPAPTTEPEIYLAFKPHFDQMAAFLNALSGLSNLKGANDVLESFSDKSPNYKLLNRILSDIKKP